MDGNNIYKILVIEDNAGDFALVEEFLLEKIGSVTISQAINYKTARDILTSADQQFDIILLDLSLPDKTGIALIESIVEISRNAAVIVLTGYTDFGFGVNSFALGIADYIVKDELTSLILYKSIVYSIERKKIMSELQASEKRVRSFANQLNNALEEERSRIAREIHDEFGQQLSGLKMSLSSLKKLNSNDHNAQALINSLVGDVNISIDSVRQIANELRPVLLDKFGLFAAIEWLLTELEKKTGITSRLYMNFDPPDIDKALQINIFRICQEALTNIIKHAKATLVNIEIESLQEQLIIKIIDNGDGIKSSTLHNPLSMGLLNMKERATLIGAELDISSSAHKGTTIKLIVNKHGTKDINSRRSFSN